MITHTLSIHFSTLQRMYQTAVFMSDIWGGGGGGGGGSAPPYSYLGGLKHPLAPPLPPPLYTGSACDVYEQYFDSVVISVNRIIKENQQTGISVVQ